MFDDWSVLFIIGAIEFGILLLFVIIIYIIQKKIRKASFISMIVCDAYMWILYLISFRISVTEAISIDDYIIVIGMYTFVVLGVNYFFIWVPIGVSLILEIIRYIKLTKKKIQVESNKEHFRLLIFTIILFIPVFALIILYFVYLKVY